MYTAFFLTSRYWLKSQSLKDCFSSSTFVQGRDQGFFKPKTFKSYAVEQCRQKKPWNLQSKNVRLDDVFSFSCKCDKQTRDMCDFCLPPSPQREATDAEVLTFKPYEFLEFCWVWLLSGPVLDVLEYRNSFYHSPEAVWVKQFLQFQASARCKLNLSQ